jgi:uncharacterized membrane protein (UPF0127 family)
VRVRPGKQKEWYFMLLSSAIVLSATALILWIYLEATHIPAFANVSVGNRSYDVYLAVTPEQQAKGLMNILTIGSCGSHGNCLGMLFVKPNPPCFWMKDTFLPLKQYWISENAISYIWTGVPNSTRVICSTGDFVLETNTSTDFKIGDAFTINRKFD